tara:strand:+ start:160 stop:264 length:105 start_codon:yes stop_codon:yes gene_type:complete
MNIILAFRIKERFVIRRSAENAAHQQHAAVIKAD